MSIKDSKSSEEQHQQQYQEVKQNKRLQNESDNQQTKKAKTVTIDLFDGLPYGKFVLFDCGDRNSIRMSGQKCGLTVDQKESSKNGKKY